MNITIAYVQRAIAHELDRLHKATADAELTPRGRSIIEWVPQKPGRLGGHWVVRQKTDDGIPDGDDIGSADIVATGPTLGATFESAHLTVKRIAKAVRDARN